MPSKEPLAQCARHNGEPGAIGAIAVPLSGFWTGPELAFGITDTLVAGRFSEQALAALSVGAAVYISIFVALMGLLQAQLPVWAELNGAGRPLDVGRSVRQALYLSALTMVVGVAGWPCVRASIAASRCLTARAARMSVTALSLGSHTRVTARFTVSA